MPFPATQQPSSKSGQVDGTSKENLHLDIQKLKEERDMLDREISRFIFESYSVDELGDHISQLYEHNDIKDMGQALLGKLGTRNMVLNTEACTIDADVLSQRCVLMRLVDFSYKQYQKALQQLAGAVVIILLWP